MCINEIRNINFNDSEIIINSELCEKHLRGSDEGEGLDGGEAQMEEKAQM